MLGWRPALSPPQNRSSIRRGEESVLVGTVGQVLGVAGTCDVLGEPHPGLCQRQPKGLVVRVLGSLRHDHAVFRPPSMILSGPHSTYPDLNNTRRKYDSASAAEKR